MGRWVAVSFVAVLLVIAVDTADGHLFGRRKARSADCYSCPIPQCPPAEFCLPVTPGDPRQHDASATPGCAADIIDEPAAPVTAAEDLPSQPLTEKPAPAQAPDVEEALATETRDKTVDRPADSSADYSSADNDTGRDADHAANLPEAPTSSDPVEAPRYTAQPDPITPTIAAEPVPPIAVAPEPEPAIAPESDAGRYENPPPATTNDVLSELFGPADDENGASAALEILGGEESSASDSEPVTGSVETDDASDEALPTEEAGADVEAADSEEDSDGDDPARDESADEEKSPEELSDEELFGVSAVRPGDARSSEVKADPREWNDVTGLFSCSACVFDVTADGVILSLEGGRQLRVDFSKLSTADLLYLREFVVGKRAELRRDEAPADRFAGPKDAAVR